jgi:hypothetical protein
LRDTYVWVLGVAISLILLARIGSWKKNAATIERRQDRAHPEIANC